VRVTVHVMVWPTLGVESLTVFARAKSTRGTSIATDIVSRVVEHRVLLHEVEEDLCGIA
jgi:hypothetical protein